MASRLRHRRIVNPPRRDFQGPLFGISGRTLTVRMMDQKKSMNGESKVSTSAKETTLCCMYLIRRRRRRRRDQSLIV